MRKLATNSEVLRKIISAGESVAKANESGGTQTYADCTIASPEKCEDESMKRVLGVVWNIESDELTYTFGSLVDSLKL